MRNCFKYAQQCQNGFFENVSGINGSPLNIMNASKYGESRPTDADKHAFTVYNRFTCWIKTYMNNLAKNGT